MEFRVIPYYRDKFGRNYTYQEFVEVWLRQEDAEAWARRVFNDDKDVVKVTIEKVEIVQELTK